MTGTPPPPPGRPISPPPRPSKPATQAEVERALALRDVMDHAVRVQREISEAKPLGASRRVLLAAVLCVPLLAFSAYSILARPEFIWGPPLALPMEQREAGVRVGMFLLAQRIEAVRAARGDYPQSLAEIGEASSGMEYRVFGDTLFELRLRPDSASEIVFRSNENSARFLGDSPLKIQGRPR